MYCIYELLMIFWSSGKRPHSVVLLFYASLTRAHSRERPALVTTTFFELSEVVAFESFDCTFCGLCDRMQPDQGTLFYRIARHLTKVLSIIFICHVDNFQRKQQSLSWVWALVSYMMLPNCILNGIVLKGLVFKLPC